MRPAHVFKYYSLLLYDLAHFTEYQTKHELLQCSLNHAFVCKCCHTDQKTTGREIRELHEHLKTVAPAFQDSIDADLLLEAW